jgi:arylsulfatase A-like enzyme
MPGMPEEHLRYPDLLELMEVPNHGSGTLAIKSKYHGTILHAKDRALRHGRWKLVYQPMETGNQISMYDVEADPACRHDISAEHPTIRVDLWTRLQEIMAEDLPCVRQ